MTEPVRRPDPHRPAGASGGTPLWVKVMGVITLVVVLLLVALLVTRGPDGGGHGPGRHTMPITGTEPDEPR